MAGAFITYTKEIVSNHPNKNEIKMDIPLPFKGKKIKLMTCELNAFYGQKQALFKITSYLPEKSVSAIIGPSGCGKSTYLRCLNRLHETVPGASTTGNIYFENLDIVNSAVEAAAIRRRIGMVFQKPNPFPAMSIYDNVSAGIKLLSWRKPKNLDEIVEDALKKSALWEEVKSELNKKGLQLSGGQQQRLCIARTLAVEPEIILFDEPTSALDPGATSRIEDLILDLKKDYTVVIVTHNISQAARIADYINFFYLGELVEADIAEKILENAENELTENFITGKFG